jgi:integrase
MAARNYNPPTDYVTFHVRKDRKNRDGTKSILTLVRVPKFDRVSKTFKTMEDARAWAIPLVTELTKQKKRGAKSESSSITISGLIEKYLEDPTVQLKISKSSYDGYADLAQFWVSNYANVRVSDFGRSMLEEARDKLMIGKRRGKKRAPATVNRYLSVMRRIWHWGQKTERISDERNWPLELLLPEPQGRIRYLSNAELNSLLDAAEADPLMRAAILVSIATGLRQGELLKLKWSDVDLTKGWVTVFGKNKTFRRVHLTSQAVAALEKLKAAKVVSPTSVFILDNGKPLKQSWLEVRWRRIRDAAGLVDFHWHDLRHTCASILAQNGASSLQIAEVLGHKTLEMVKRYSHLVQGAPVTGHAALDDMLKGGK